MKYIFLFLMIIGTIFIDLPLAQKIGTMGKSLMIFIAPTIAALVYFSSKKAKIILNRFDVKLFWVYWLVTFFLSLIMLNINMFITGNLYAIYGQNMFIKLLKASTYNLIFTLAYYNYSYIFMRLNYKALSFVFVITFVFLTAIGFLEIYNKNIFNLFHNISVNDGRLRLLTSEPSQAGLLYGIFLLLALFFTKNIFLRLLILIAGLAIIYLISSKGALLNITIAIAVVYFIGLNFKQKIKTSLIFIPVVAILVYIFIPRFISSLLVDTQNFTSFSTRFTGFVSGLLVLIYYPLGTGYGTYLNYFPDIAEKAKLLVQDLFPFPLNFTELNVIIETAENIGLKSGVLFQILPNGWIAILFFSVLFTKTYRKINMLNIDNQQNIILKILIIFILIEIITSVDIEVMYAYLIPIALIHNFYYSQKSKLQEKQIR